MRTNTLTQVPTLRAIAQFGLTVALLGCAAPEGDVGPIVIPLNPDSWIGAPIDVLFHYLGTPNSIECINGRVVLEFWALDRRMLTFAGVPLNFCIDNGSVVEVTGLPVDRPLEEFSMPLWGRTEWGALMPPPSGAQLDKWDRRLGL